MTLQGSIDRQPTRARVFISYKHADPDQETGAAEATLVTHDCDHRVRREAHHASMRFERHERADSNFAAEAHPQRECPQFGRAGAVSLITVATDVATLVLMIELFKLHTTAAAIVGSTCGAITKFALGKLWAFRDSSRLRFSQIARYLGMAAGSIVLVAASMHVLSSVLGLPYLLAKVLSGVLAFSCWSYPVQARVVFSSRKERR